MDASQWATPDLQELVDLFYDSPEELGEFEEVEADQLPLSYRQLLAHHSHMTVTLEEFHRSMVDVRVLDSITSNSHYSRTIVLHRKSDSRAVQYGIVRLHRVETRRGARAFAQSIDTARCFQTFGHREVARRCVD